MPIKLVKNNDTLHLTNGIKTRGDSAYEVAVANGFEGTEEEWLASLKGETGEQGEPGVRIGTTPPEDESLIWINPLSNVEDYATKQYVDDAIANIPEVDLSDYATQKYVDDAIAGIDFPEPNLSDYATKKYVDDAVAGIDIPETDLSDYYTKTEVNNLIPKEPDLSGYALKTEIPDVSSYTTMAAVEAKGYQTEAQVLDLIEEHGGTGTGEKGEPGDSAYEVAVANGFKGTEQEWLDSLKGEPGEQGEQGEPGKDYVLTAEDKEAIAALVLQSVEDSPLPVEVYTEEEMEAVLSLAEVGSIYKYVGASGTYRNGTLYIVEAE